MIRFLSCLAMLVTILVSACAPMPSSSTYKFHKELFGLGNYKYNGPVNNTAAVDYISDAKSAVRSVYTSKSVSRVFFHIGSGTLVVKSGKDARPNNYEMQHFIETFRVRHVMVHKIVLKNYGGNFTIDILNNLKNYGGDARFWALRNINLASDVVRPASAVQSKIILDAFRARPN